MRKIIVSIIIMCVLFASLISAINVNNKLLEQHNNILKSYTIFDFFDSKKFNTYLIPDTKLSPREELSQVWIKNKELRSYRLQREQEREQLEKDLAKKTKNWRAVIDDKAYFGFDEELYGTKEFYFYWE